MKKVNAKQAVLVSVAGALLVAPNTFAAVNNYGIEYTGGAQLSASNVQIESEMISGLTKLLGGGTGTTTTYSTSTSWATGYFKKSSTECLSIKYLKISKNGLKNAGNDVYVTKANDNYQYTAKVKNIEISEELATNLGNDKYFEVDFGADDTGSHIRYGDHIYSDNQCQTEDPNIMYLNSTSGMAYVEMNVALSKKGETKPLKSDQLYYALADIDASQSYKILNTDNALAKSNMFAKSASILQPSTGDLKNMYVSNGNYIYSQPHIANDGTNIYVKLANSAQSEGLNIVYGFGGNAASSIVYYAKQYTVKYVADEGGKITGAATETVLSGNNPSGSKVTADEGKVLTGWIADKDVKLGDGTVIKFGEAISVEQMKLVEVNADVTFRATFGAESEIAVPDTGASTKEINAIFASVSVGAVLAIALAAAITPRLLHKRVGFKK